MPFGLVETFGKNTKDKGIELEADQQCDGCLCLDGVHGLRAHGVISRLGADGVDDGNLHYHRQLPGSSNISTITITIIRMIKFTG